MLLAVRISSYGCTWEVWRALKKLELLSAIALSNSYASFVLSKLPACIHNSIYTHAKHEPILYWGTNYSLFVEKFKNKFFKSKKDNFICKLR